MNGTDLLRAWAKRNGRTQRQMADSFGITPVYVWQLLSGRANVAGLGLAFRIERETAGEVPASSWLIESTTEAVRKPVVRRNARRASRKPSHRSR